jgi:hypothetical protein
MHLYGCICIDNFWKDIENIQQWSLLRIWSGEVQEGGGMELFNALAVFI